MKNKLKDLQHDLSHHAIYSTLHNLKNIRFFMQLHVFAVWDFMGLLKSLQRQITCVEVPWRPSLYPAEMVRMVNQIVLGEESDLDQEGRPCSHFELYLKAMDEVAADTSLIRNFIQTMDFDLIPDEARNFVRFNLQTAMEGGVLDVAASFFYGREKLIPEMFETIVTILQKEKIHAPTFIFYLKRHIEVDGDEHGPLAEKCLAALTAGDPQKEQKALVMATKALEMRKELWNNALKFSLADSSPKLVQKMENSDLN